MSDSKNACDWCEHNPYGCSQDESCDFKSLEYQEDAIVQRIDDEVAGINEKKRSIADESLDRDEAQKLFSEIADTAKGIQIMVDRLKQEFGYSEKDIKEKCGFEDASTSFVTKTKLAAKLAKMKFRRKKKK